VADDCEPPLLENRIPQGRERRTQTVSTKLTPAEEGELQRASSAEGKKMAEWVRDVLLESARRNFPSAVHDSMLLTEVVGIQLFLMNVLSPVTRGEVISGEQYENIIRSVQANKGRTTRELLARRRNTEKE
jgi:hypothetical protein